MVEKMTDQDFDRQITWTIVAFISLALFYLIFL